MSADVSARLGRPTSADVRVCADVRVLSRLVGGCSQAGSSTTGSLQADRASGVRVRARVPRLAVADLSIGTRRSRPRATVSADASTSGTTGPTPGASGGAGDPVTTFAPLRPSVADSSTLSLTGAASDLLALVAAGLLVADVLIVLAARPATAARKGGEDR